MAICRTGNTVNFGTYSLTVTPTGLYTDGRLDFAGCSLTPTQAQGSVSGYATGGIRGVPQTTLDITDKFPFSSDTSSTDIAESLVRVWAVGQSSLTSGYISGGQSSSSPTFTSCTTIGKFSFSSDSPATCIADLTQGRRRVAGQSSTTSGYTSGGETTLNVCTNTIDKFSFSSDANASDVGEMSVAGNYVVGQSSAVNGYIARAGNIEKFPFAADTPSSDIAEAATSFDCHGSGHNSAENGYFAGGRNPSIVALDTIEKFPFATDANATDIGELTTGTYRGSAGSSSLASGYTAGGSPSPRQTTIDKFPFAADGSATDVGELSCCRYGLAGQQV